MPTASKKDNIRPMDRKTLKEASPSFTRLFEQLPYEPRVIEFIGNKAGVSIKNIDTSYLKRKEYHRIIERAVSTLSKIAQFCGWVIVAPTTLLALAASAAMMLVSKLNDLLVSIMTGFQYKKLLDTWHKENPVPSNQLKFGPSGLMHLDLVYEAFAKNVKNPQTSWAFKALQCITAPVFLSIAFAIEVAAFLAHSPLLLNVIPTILGVGVKAILKAPLFVPDACSSVSSSMSTFFKATDSTKKTDAGQTALQAAPAPAPAAAAVATPW